MFLNTFYKTIAHSKEWVLDILFPAECFGCGKEGKYICEKCRGLVMLHNQRSCPFCEKEIFGGRVCRRCLKRTHLDGIISATYYGNPLIRKAIWALKYQSIRSVIGELKDILTLSLSKFKYLLPPDKGNTLLVPVPLYRWKQKERGFNQAEILANIVGEIIGVKVGALLLVRKRRTSRQIDVPVSQRKDNVRGAFCLSEEGKRTLILNDVKIILVDDVFTTGATMDECARVLREAGVKEIWGLVLARG